MSAPVEFVSDVCGIFFRSILLEHAGDEIAQHVHDHDHATYCGNGSASLYVDGELHPETVMAGTAVAIISGHAHRFVALEDNTRLTCVHDVASAQSIKQGIEEKGV